MRRIQTNAPKPAAIIPLIPFIALAIGLPHARAQQAGDLLWTHEIEIPTPAPPERAPDGGIIFYGTNAAGGGYGGVNELSADGDLLWNYPAGNAARVSFATDRVYVGEILPGSLNAVTALNADNGQVIWQAPIFDGSYGFLAGPDVGPDGNIYAITDVPLGEGSAVSFTPDGFTRWELPGFAAQGAGATHIEFSGQRAIKLEEHTPVDPEINGSDAGMVGLTFDGDLDWFTQINVGPSFASRQPAISPTTGYVHVSDHDTLRAYDPATGDEVWSRYVGFAGQSMTAPTVGADGVTYAVHDLRDLVAIDADGDLLWTADEAAPDFFPSRPAVSPDGTMVAFTHNTSDACPESPFICRGGVVVVDIADGSILWRRLMPELTTGQAQPVGAVFSADSSRVFVAARAYPAFGSELEDMNLSYLFAFQAINPPLEADFNDDGCVNNTDLGVLLAGYLACDGDADYNAAADLTGDGCIDNQDLGALLAEYLMCE